MSKLRIGPALTIAALLVPELAYAWTGRVPFSAHVHQHEFSSVALSNEGCVLKLRLAFEAPAEAYHNELPSKNYYRFRARVRLDTGTVVTRVFHNDAPGSRQYDYDEDTTAAGCWAKQAAHPRAVDVEGCRGRGCTPEPFKD